MQAHLLGNHEYRERQSKNTPPASLRTTPKSGERGFVDHELGFTKSACRNCSTRISNLLDMTLGSDKEVDQRSYEGVGTAISGVLIDKALEHQGGITRPGVKIVRIRSARTRNDNSGL